MDSRRQFERIRLGRCPASVVRAGFTFFTRPDLGIEMLNLSEAGMSLVVKERIAPRATIRASIHVLAFDEKIDGVLSVIRCAPYHDGPGGFVLGAFFLKGPAASRIEALRQVALSAEGQRKIDEQARFELLAKARGWLTVRQKA